MNPQYFLLSAAFSLISLFSFAQTKTDSMRVSGNCESCESRIEKAAKSAGAISAKWDENTSMLLVSYDASKTSNLKIQQSIAAKGHDTPDVKATDSAYNQLPECCQYERKSKSLAEPAKSACCMDKNTSNAKNCCATDAKNGQKAACCTQ